jgi:hypothetical protein
VAGSIGYVHGDLRPSHILVDFHDNLVIGNFVGSAPIRQPSLSGAEVSCPLEFEYGGKQSELYVSLQHFQWFCSGSFSVEELQTVIFPPTSDLPFGGIMEYCCKNRFPLLDEMSHAVVQDYRGNRNGVNSLLTMPGAYSTTVS